MRTPLLLVTLLFPFICNAAVNRDEVLRLAELDARAYCVSYLPKCEFIVTAIPKNVLDTSAWRVSISHVVMADKWRLYAPGGTSLEIYYDENGNIVSDHKPPLPSRLDATAKVGFMRFCGDMLEKANMSSKVSICACAADKVLLNNELSDLFTTRIENWSPEMKSQDGKARIGNMLAEAVQSCAEQQVHNK